MSRVARHLVWVEIRSKSRKQKIWRASTPFGDYTVFEDGEWWAPQIGENRGLSGTSDQAKLDADADFNRRVEECCV